MRLTLIRSKSAPLLSCLFEPLCPKTHSLRYDAKITLRRIAVLAAIASSAFLVPGTALLCRCSLSQLFYSLAGLALLYPVSVRIMVGLRRVVRTRRSHIDRTTPKTTSVGGKDSPVVSRQGGTTSHGHLAAETDLDQLPDDLGRSFGDQLRSRDEPLVGVGPAEPTEKIQFVRLCAGGLSANTPVHPSRYFRTKEVVDRALATLLLVPALPVIGLLVLLVRLTSRGPGIYCQVRIGRHGRKFLMYKIRTMHYDAEAASGPVWAQVRDPRATLVGRVLRRRHLDELPQLLNIVKGEMSLVGPCSERPGFVHVLAEAIPGYLDRLVVPPGATGLAQLNLPPDTDLDSVRRKLVLDCEYIRQAGPWLDLRLFACTGLRMLKIPERWSLRMFGLHRDVTVPTILEGPSGTSGNGGNGGNGADGAHAADHAADHAAGDAAVTPTSIQAKVAHSLIKGDGSPPGHQKHSGKRLHGGNGRSKPR